MCIGCKYFQDGACEFLLQPETCDQFDLGDKFEEEQNKIPVLAHTIAWGEEEPCKQR